MTVRPEVLRSQVLRCQVERVVSGAFLAPESRVLGFRVLQGVPSVSLRNVRPKGEQVGCAATNDWVKSIFGPRGEQGRFSWNWPPPMPLGNSRAAIARDAR